MQSPGRARIAVGKMALAINDRGPPVGPLPAKQTNL